MAKPQKKNDASWKSHAPPAEWAAAIISTVLVSAMLVFTIRQAVTSGSLPPLISVRADTIIETDAGYLVMFTASNSGDETAAAVHVGGALMRDSVTVEQSDATIDYVPPQSSRTGGILFSKDPRLYRLHLRTLGFGLP